MKVFITGSPGTGKTSVINALSVRGYTAYSTEDLGLNKYFDSETGSFVPRPAPPVRHGRFKNTWDMPKLKELLESDDLVFIADLNSTQYDYYDLFDRVIVLTADNKTLSHRLRHRDSNPYDYGKHPAELKHIMSYNLRLSRKLLDAPRAVAIDATIPLPLVIEHILQEIK